VDKPANSSDRIECRGGPCDGEQVTDRGLFWRAIARYDPERPEAVGPGMAGTYVLRGREYRWEPDP
jgi:hypothetical protein